MKEDRMLVEFDSVALLGENGDYLGEIQFDKIKETKQAELSFLCSDHEDIERWISYGLIDQMPVIITWLFDKEFDDLVNEDGQIDAHDYPWDCKHCHCVQFDYNEYNDGHSIGYDKGFEEAC